MPSPSHGAYGGPGVYSRCAWGPGVLICAQGFSHGVCVWKKWSILLAHSTSEWRAGSTSEWRAGSTSEWRAGSTSEWRAGSTSEWHAGYTSEWRAGYTSEWRAGSTSEWRAGSTSEWRAGSTSEWHAGSTSEWRAGKACGGMSVSPPNATPPVPHAVRRCVRKSASRLCEVSVCGQQHHERMSTLHIKTHYYYRY